MAKQSMEPAGSSHLVLGTVQLGLPYGVANTHGQPDYRRARDIIETALGGGIRCFDTAAAYGTSEQVLGQALRELGALDDVTIVTKVRHLNQAEHAQPDLAAEAIRQSIDDSRRHLGLDCIPFVLFHNPADAVYADALEDCRERGWVARIGLSLAQPPYQPVRIDPRYTAIQLPGNLLDHWLRKPDIVASLSKPDLAVFLRSVYLQGLLVMPHDKVPPHLAGVLPVRRRLATIADELDLTEAELALRYSLGLGATGGVLIGVETPDQLRENIRIAASGLLPQDITERIDRAAADLDERLLSPSTWPTLEQEANTRRG